MHSKDFEDDFKSRMDGYYKTEYEFRKLQDAYWVYTQAHCHLVPALPPIHDKKKLLSKYLNAKKTIVELFEQVQVENQEEVLLKIDHAIEGLSLSREDVRKPYMKLVYKELEKASLSKSTINKIIIPIFKDLNNTHEK